MADGTVRGTFALDAEPAIRAQRGIRDSALEADTAVRKLGGSLDDVASTAVRSAGTVKESWRSMKDSIADDARAIGLRIDEVDVKLDKVSKKRSTPHIDVTGIDRAIAQIEVLDARLDALSRQRATPRVAVGGGFSGGAASLAGAGASGGGGGSSTAARAAARGGGFPTTPALLALGAAAIPPLTGAAVGLTASATSAAIGAGELGLAGLGVGAAGLVPGMIVGKEETKNIQQAMKDQTAYNQAVAQYGQYSKQAETAHKKLDAEFAQQPGLRGAIGSVNELSKAWENATKQARNQFNMGVAGVASNVRRALPALEPGFTRDSFAMQDATRNLSGAAFSGTSLQTMQQLQGEFARDLPHVEHTLENLLNVTDHLVQASLPYFHEGIVWIDHMTSGWSQWSNSTTNVDHAVSSTVTSLKDWAHFGGAAVRVVKDLFAPATQPGDSAVVSMTRTLDRWDTWLKDNPEKVRSFIRDAETTTGHIAKAVLSIADALWKVATALGPVLDRFAQLASIGSGAGLLIPAGLRFAAGHYFGRGAQADGVASAAAIGTVGTRAGGGVVAGRASAAEAAAGRMSSGAILLGPAETLSRREQALLRTNLGAEPAAAEMSSIQSAALRSRSAITGALSTARGFVLPAMGISAILSAAQYGTGGAGATGLVDNLLSGASFGLVKPQIAGPSGSALQGQAAQQMLQAITGGGTSRIDLGLRDVHSVSSLFNEERLRANISAAGTAITQGPRVAGPGRLPEVPTSLAQSEQGYMALTAAVGRYETAAERAHGKSKDVLLGEAQAMRTLRQQYADYQAQQARHEAGQFQAAFGLESSKLGPVKAMRDIANQVFREQRKMGPEGAKILDQNMLDWARGMAKNNPRLQRIVDDLQNHIRDSFSATGQHIAIVNGQIYTGSRDEWQNITAAMQDPLERAREKMDHAFTDVQNQAVGSLTAMGFSHGQATALVHGLEQGGKSGTAASAAVSGRQQGGVLGGTTSQAGLAAIGAPRKALGGRMFAAGGRLPGVGVADTVKMADGGYGAPGELVVNPFTEADVSRDLQMSGRPTLAERVAREWRPAWMGRAGVPTGPATPSRFALGGALSSTGSTAQGAGGSGGYVFPFPSGSSVTWERVDQGQDIRGPAGGYVLAVGPGNVAIASPNPGGFGSHYPLLTLTSGPLMGKTLYYGHTKGLVTGAVGAGQTIAQTGYGRGDTSWQGNASGIPGHLEIGFWPPGSMSSGGAAAALMHSLASHTAVGGGGVGAALGGIGHVSLHGLGSQGLHGVPGALLDRGSQIIAAGMQQKLNAKLATMGGMGTAGAAGISGDIMQIAQQAAAAAGLQFDANIVKTLLQKESSGGQNLPPHSYGGALDPAGPFQVIGSTFQQYDPGGNRMNPADNALAAMRYIKSRYGSLQAMASTTGLMGGGYHGYSLGGRMAEWGGWHDTGLDAVTKPGRPVVFGAGERRQERVTITPVTPRGPSAGASTPTAGGVHVSIGQITVQGSIRSDADIEQIGEHVAAKIIQALDRGEHRAAETA